MFVHGAMPDLHRLMRCDEVGADVRKQAGRDQSGGRRNETVNDHRNPARRSGDHDAGEPRDFETADFGKYVEGVRGIGPVDGKSLLDNPDFVHQSFVVNAGAASGDGGDGQTGQDGGDGRSRA